MADNFDVTAGSGKTVATDDISGVHYQKVKIALGADNALDTLVDSGQQTMANSVPVVIASDQGDINISLDGEAVVLGAGSAAIGKLAANDGVDIGDVDVASIVPGTGATNLGKAEDAVHASGDTGVMALAVRNDTLAALAGADGDYAPLQVNASGALYTEDVNSSEINTSLNNIETDANTLAGAVSGSEMQVDVVAALPAGTNAIGKLAANSGVDIGDVDVLSIVPGTGATNLGKAEDGAHTTGDVGVMALAVRDDAGSAFGADGDYVPLSIDSAGALRVTGGGGGTEYNEDVATPATIVGTATLMERDDALSTVTPVEGDWIAFRGTAEGALWTQDFNSDAILADTNTIAGAVSGSEMQVDVVAALPAGTNAIGKLAANSGVDIGDVDVLSVVPGTGATNLGKAEDAVHSTGDTGIMALAVRNDTLAALAGADGDYAPFQVNASGALFIQEGAAMDVSAATVTVDNGGTFAVQVDGDALTALQLIDDAVYADDADWTDNSSKHLLVGGVYQSSEHTVTDGDVSPLAVDSNGRLKVSIEVDNASIGGGTEYSEDAATPATIVGKAIVVERDDALSTVTPAEADWIGLRGTAEGALWTQDFNSDAIRTAVELIDDAIAGSEMQVDVVASLPAGTNAIGKLAANSGVDIGDVDVLSIVPGTGATNLGKAEDAAHTTGDVGVMALAVRNDVLAALGGTDGDYAPMQVDSAGALWVVDKNSSEMNTSLNNIETAVELIDNAISGSEMQVDVVAALPAGTNAIGKLAANSGVDIGDVDVTSITGVTMSNDGMQITGDEAHDAADAGNPVKIGGRAQDLIGAEPEEVADNDRVDALFDTNGRMGVCAGSDYKHADINDSTSGNNTIVAAAGAGKRIAVWSIMVVSDGTVDVRFEDGAGGTAFTGQIPLEAREGFTYSSGGLVPLFVGSANTLLNLELSAAINVHGHVAYTVLDD